MRKALALLMLGAFFTSAYAQPDPPAYYGQDDSNIIITPPQDEKELNELEKEMTAATLKGMHPGQSGYTLGWAYDPFSGRLNLSYPFCKESFGTCAVRVKRKMNGEYVVDLDSWKAYELQGHTPIDEDNGSAKDIEWNEMESLKGEEYEAWIKESRANNMPFFIVMLLVIIIGSIATSKVRL